MEGQGIGFLGSAMGLLRQLQINFKHREKQYLGDGRALGFRVTKHPIIIIFQ